MQLSPGDKLGPYEILASIGAGGMGEVYRARDARLNRIVAIKVSGAQFSERFEREAKAIAALNHPNIYQIYDVGSSRRTSSLPQEVLFKLLDFGLAKHSGDSSAPKDETVEISGRPFSNGNRSPPDTSKSVRRRRLSRSPSKKMAHRHFRYCRQFASDRRRSPGYLSRIGATIPTPTTFLMESRKASTTAWRDCRA
jgi:hypothetical protein